MEWIKISEQQPPDEEVHIRDEYGNEGIGQATWYPFTVEKLPGDERKPWGWRGTVIPCENHWDGGWLILGTHGLGEHYINGEIVEWAYPDNRDQYTELDPPTSGEQ